MCKKVMTATHLKREIKELVEELARKQGVSTSEYIRNLILRDLEKRGLLKEVTAQ